LASIKQLEIGNFRSALENCDCANSLQVIRIDLQQPYEWVGHESQLFGRERRESPKIAAICVTVATGQQTAITR
jgi:hypothetical protein